MVTFGDMSYVVNLIQRGNKWAASCEKVSYVLSRCHTQRGMVCTHPFFGMIPTFWILFFFWHDNDSGH